MVVKKIKKGLDKSPFPCYNEGTKRKGVDNNGKEEERTGPLCIQERGRRASAVAELPQKGKQGRKRQAIQSPEVQERGINHENQN